MAINYEILYESNFTLTFDEEFEVREYGTLEDMKEIAAEGLVKHHFKECIVTDDELNHYAVLRVTRTDAPDEDEPDYNEEDHDWRCLPTQMELNP